MVEKKMHPLVRDNQVILAAGVYDALSAKLAERAGFKVVVLTGFGVAASLIGEPDFGILTQTQILETAWRVVNAVKIPVVVDGDTGYGGVLNVTRMVVELVRMGARGILLEDQTWPKRCGHMRGKSVVPMEDHVAKIRAAREARGDALFTVTARTDAREPLGLDEAIRRGKAYKEAGADLIFIEAPRSVEELKRIAKEVPGPLVVNNIEGGKTPVMPLEELREMGFISVGYVLSGLFASAKALADTYAYLLEHGDTSGIRDKMMAFDEFNEMIGLEEKYRLDEQFG
ncbi:MAG: oxaloacetate decarboxylase [Actinobacteria bacterium]|nr:oxaloacetate decarboxylase [Actinomycetota bacterium]